jgi:hypothetical protein
VAGDSQAYAARARLILQGPLDVTALTGALRDVVRRHEIFRTRFEPRDGELTQVVEDAVEAAVDYLASGSRSEESLLEAMAADVLDPARLPLVGGRCCGTRQTVTSSCMSSTTLSTMAGRSGSSCASLPRYIPARSPADQPGSASQSSSATTRSGSARGFDRRRRRSWCGSGGRG